MSQLLTMYVAALCRLAEHCAFGDMLNEMLRDRVVCSIKNSAIQKQLLAKPEMTLMKAVSVTQATKLADTGVKELQSSTARASSVFPRKTRIYTNLHILPQLSLQTIPAKSRNVTQSTILISVISSQGNVMPVVSKATLPEFAKVRREYRLQRLTVVLHLLLIR